MESTSIEMMVSMTELTERIGLSRGTIYLMMEDGTFPKPIRIGTRRIAWKITVIDKWLEDREALS